MKKLVLFLAIIFISLFTFASDVKVYLCDEDYSKIINRAILNDCNELKTNDTNWQIKSFTLGFRVGDDYVSFKSNDKSLSERLIKKLKEISPVKIYLENIILVNENNDEIKLETQTIVVQD